jgi:hypothetical protein
MGPLPGKPVGGAPCRPRRTASIRASMSCETMRPLPRLEMVGVAVGRGLRAALMLPSGVEEIVMFAVAPEVESERAAGRSGTGSEGGTSERGLEDMGGDEGEGASKGDSGSNSPSGVEAVEAIAVVRERSAA